jgi:hypothetical protein
MTNLYRALDRLLPHKVAIEKHLVKRLGELFAIDYELLLYDVTGTYFEGVADPAIAKRGYSRAKRSDCVQVNVALVTRQGMPLCYEIFAGNTTDAPPCNRSSSKWRLGRAHRVIDRGMTSAVNLAWLDATGRRYVIGTPRAELRRFAAEIADTRNWRQIREGIEVKILRGPDGEETFLLCRSAERLEKEQAMHERFSQRIEEGLESLARRIDNSINYCLKPASTKPRSTAMRMKSSPTSRSPLRLPAAWPTRVSGFARPPCNMASVLFHSRPSAIFWGAGQKCSIRRRSGPSSKFCGSGVQDAGRGLARLRRGTRRRNRRGRGGR